jgi:DNA-binding NarL/FixJ family response regulator
MSQRLLHNKSAEGPAAEKSPIDSLSDRELEVFEMIAQGLTTQQIAAKLDLSRKTIETHRENIKTKLDLSNSASLARYAIEWMFRRA